MGKTEVIPYKASTPTTYNSTVYEKIEACMHAKKHQYNYLLGLMSLKNDLGLI